MAKGNPSPTPMVDESKLQRSPKFDVRPYKELVRSLMYLAICTRPDIAHAVSVLGQFNGYHGENHWQVAKCVLRYLKGTCKVGLTYKTNNDKMVGYMDAEWGSNLVDRKSYTGWVFTLGDTAMAEKVTILEQSVIKTRL